MIDYDQLAADYAVHRTVNPAVIRALVKGAALTAESRVLEVGCGTGNYAKSLQETIGCRTWGVDPSAEMLAVAASRCTAIDYRTGTAENTGLGDHRFDLVLTVDVIHHVKDHAAAFCEAYRVLASDGQVCTVTDSESIIRNRRPLSVYFPETIAVDLLRYPSLPTLRRNMARAGFVDMKQQSVEWHDRTTDIKKYRDRAFSCLHLISDQAFHQGIAQLESDLKEGPIGCVSRYALLWGTKPSTRSR